MWNGPTDTLDALVYWPGSPTMALGEAPDARGGARPVIQAEESNKSVLVRTGSSPGFERQSDA